MPTQTFFNLKEEKRNKILDISVDEFANNTFTNVSINQIIKKAGIPRGSFYQYFENKEDLYMYIIKEMGKEKMRLISEVLNKNKAQNFVNECIKILEVSIIMGIKHPKHNKIYKNMELDQSEFINKLKENDQGGKRLLVKLIKKDQEAEIIKKSVNPEILASVILAVLNSITKKEYLKDNYMKATEEFKEVLKIIERGIKNV